MAFKWIHPDVGISLANYFSKTSRESQELVQNYLGHDREWLIDFVENFENKNQIDFFVFGHRHIPIDYRLKMRYLVISIWEIG